MSSPVAFPQHIRVVDHLNLAIAMTKIYHMSIAYLVLSVILFALGIGGQLGIGAYIFGATVGANPIWTSLLWVITNALGVVTFKNGIYRLDTAIPHLILIILSSITTIGALVCVALGISFSVNQGYERFIPTAVVGSAMIIAYAAYIGCGIYQTVVFARIVQTGVFGPSKDQPLQSVNIQSHTYQQEHEEKQGSSY